MSDENESTRYVVSSEFKPEKDDGHLRGPCIVILESIQLFRWIDLNINNAQAIRDLEEEIRDLKRKLVEDREERDNKRPNDNNIPTSNTPTTTIPSTSTNSIPTKTTTTFTFPDISSHTTIDDTFTSTTTTTTTTILSKTTTNTNTITTNSPKTTDNIDLSKTLFHLFLQNQHLKIILAALFVKKN
ncbi:hypothetical protein F8M41_008382 [Gigaspora margarita]|uniref:Uncharacterized protein n=1 Tax=Gigaspora margarita TaxID=4874 RepID=A0A8H4ER28_GIGMA|nr:hypothetical protein F8M41_008382 [Gigaspora margarita]